MKKVEHLCLTFIVIICVCYSALAQTNAGITSIGVYYACPGTIITLPLSISGSPDIGSLSLELDYDGAVLSYLQTGSTAQGLTNTNTNLYNNGGKIQSQQSTISGSSKRLRLSWTSSDGQAYTIDNNGTGLLCNLSFKYFGGSTTLDFNNSLAGGGMCEYSSLDTSLNTITCNDNPTSSFYVNGGVNQNPVPSQPGNISGPVTPCHGTIIFSVTNDTSATYTWINTCNFAGNSTSNSISFIINSNSIPGIIIVVPSNSCGTGTPTSIEITSILSPSFAPSSANASPAILSTGSSTLSVSGGSLGTEATWKWYSGSCGGNYLFSGVSPLIYPTVTDIYFARAEGICNTTTCASVTITVNNSSINDKNLQDLENTGYGLIIYPNPANNVIDINYNIYYDDFVNISLYNLVGEKIINFENKYRTKGKYQIISDISDLQSGIYSFRMIINNNSVIIRKLVIAR